MTAATLDVAVQVMLAEYKQLKDEQRTRIGFRDNLIYAVLIASAAVASATAARGAVFLALLPPVAALLGWAYLMNDIKVTQIGDYLRTELGPALAELTAGLTVPVFGWEQPGHGDPHRRRRKSVQLAADLTAFCGLPLVALAVLGHLVPRSLPVALVVAVELGMLGVLAAEIIRAAEVGPTGSWAELRRKWQIRLRAGLSAGRFAVYFQPRDLWVGVYVAEPAVYVCPIPCLVVRWSR